MKKNNILKKSIEAFSKYEPRNEQDKEQHQNNLDNFEKVFERIWEGIETIGLNGDVVAELPVKHIFPGVDLPVSGQVDLAGLDENGDKCLIEIKTKWRKRTGKYKSDGTPSFSLAKPIPMDDYFAQTNFYALCTGFKPYLLIANENEFSIYSENDCEQLKPENREKYYEKMRRTCIRRERLAARHQGQHTWTQDVELKTNVFWWDEDHRIIGEELWNKNL